MAENDENGEDFDSIIFENRAAKIGIFWISNYGKRDAEIIAFPEEARAVKGVSGFRDTNKTHIEYWDKVDLRGDYTSIPRGRVQYDEEREKYVVSIAPSGGPNTATSFSNDQNILSMIFRKFSLPIDKIVVAIDEHYGDGDNPLGNFIDDADDIDIMDD